MFGTFPQRNFRVCLLWVIDFFCDLKFNTLMADLNLEISDKQQDEAEEDDICGGRVPTPRPPSSLLCESKSPIDAPSGRVRTYAI